MLIEVCGLSHVIAGRTVLAAPDFTVSRGERVLLTGPSGSGKTTLINVLAGLVTPSAGQVRVDGTAMSAAPAAARDALRKRTFGIVFQTLRLLPALTVRQNLEIAQQLAWGRTDGALAEALLARVGLAQLRHARPRRLSQGEAQRAAIARALATRPKLVMADEPTSALDDGHARTVLELLMETAAETGAGLLIATHDNRLRGRFDRELALTAPREGS